MIALPEKVLHDFRAVARRAGRNGRSASSLFHLLSSRDGTRLQSLSEDVRIEYHHPTSAPSTSLVLPMSLITECDAKAGRDVEFHPHASGNVEVRWQRSGAPFTRTFAHGMASPTRFPAWPSRSAIIPPSSLDDLDQAMQILSNDRGHSGFCFLRLRGSHGDIAATDGKQLLLQRGYPFPWKDSLLVPRSLVFGAPELPGETPIRVGLSEEHVLFRIGPWTIALKIEANARYPNVDALIPAAATPRTQCTFAEAEAEELPRVLRELPACKEADAAVTLDVNGKVALRARGDEEQRCTEVPLPGSTSEGAAVRVATNRLMLQRALALGFRTVQIRDPGKPLMCQDEQRIFLWAPLNHQEALAPQRNPVRVALTVNARPAASNRFAPPLRTFSPPATQPVTHEARTPVRIGKVARGLWSLVRRFHRSQDAA